MTSRLETKNIFRISTTMLAYLHDRNAFLLLMMYLMRWRLGVQVEEAGGTGGGGWRCRQWRLAFGVTQMQGKVARLAALLIHALLNFQ